MTERTSKVAALITAESIIVAFLVAFMSGINQTLVFWIDRRQPITGVVFAGLLISLLALTAFRSILLLYQSIDISDVDGAMRSDERYRVGYDLFLMVILLTGVFVLVNAFSILHYAVAHGNASVPGCQSLIIVGAGLLSSFLGVLFVFRPFELTRFVRRVRNCAGTRLLPFAKVFGLADVVLFAAMMILWQSLSLWPALILFVTFVGVTIAEVGMIWMLMMPGNAKDDPE